MRLAVDQLLKDLFDDCDETAETTAGTLPPQHPQIPGLVVLKGFLDAEEQDEFLKQIDGEGWFNDPGSNQAMRFGDLPGWAESLGQRTPTEHFPSHAAVRQPLFDQIIVNLYHPGDGIAPHIDLLRFEDGIAIYSFGDAAIMHLTRDDDHRQVLLEGGDLLLLSGEARYEWKHGILPVLEEEYEGRTIRRGRRVSVTMRKLCTGIVLSHQ